MALEKREMNIFFTKSMDIYRSLKLRLWTFKNYAMGPNTSVLWYPVLILYCVCISRKQVRGEQFYFYFPLIIALMMMEMLVFSKD